MTQRTPTRTLAMAVLADAWRRLPHTRQLDALHQSLTRLATDVSALQEVEVRYRERTHQVTVEGVRGRWQFWVALVGGSAGIATTLITALAQWRR